MKKSGKIFWGIIFFIGIIIGGMSLFMRHQITDIQLLRHENGKGTPAEAMIPEMIRQNI